MSCKSDFDIFLEKYNPLQHPNEEGFYMYETYGEEYEMVQKHIKEKGNEYCWTVVDADGKLYLIPGWHYINRLGYLLSTVPFKEGEREYKY